MKTLMVLLLAGTSWSQTWWEVQGSNDQKVILKAASSPDEAVRLSVAEHIKPPQQALIILASDKSEHIRMELASRPGDLPIEAQKILAKDPSVKVAIRLAGEATYEPVQNTLLDRGLMMLGNAVTVDQRVQALDLIQKFTVNGHVTIGVLERVSKLPLAETAARAERKLLAKKGLSEANAFCEAYKGLQHEQCIYGLTAGR